MTATAISTDLPAAPSTRQMQRLTTVLDPLARVTQPQVHGIDRIPERGSLFVGNHTIFGFLDLPFMMSELWRRRGIVVRGLGDHGHYAIPVWRDLLELSGMVRGTRENVHALMRGNEHVLVFPGGAGEVFKARGQKYQLLWKERLGFARLAIEHSYPIVPFAAVGAEEMLEVVADDRTPGVAQVSSLMKRLVGVSLPPLVRGVGPTILPRPERLYFWFGDPIETARFSAGDDSAARLLRDEVRAAVEGGIETLMSERERDPQRGLVARLRGEKGKPEPPALAAEDAEAWFVVKAMEAWNTIGPDGAAAWMSRWVQLEDPPEWPDRATWRGRGAVIARLREVTDTLGAAWAEVSDANSVGDETVLVSFALHPDDRTPARADHSFHALVEIDEAQITRMRMFLDREAALAALRTGAE
jgi:1-acyl-sn-glycerol-3-phosphate acyltransferase